MFYGYIPPLYWPSAQSSTNSSTSPSKSNTTNSSTSPSKSTPATTGCTSSWLLEVLLYVHTGFYLLAGAYAVSSLHHDTLDNLAAELLMLGTCGALTSTLAIMGLWYRQRQFLLPLVIFLLATIVLDCISVFYSQVSSPDAEPLFPKMSPISLYPETDHPIPFLLVKLLFTIWLVKRLISMYRKNLSIRTGRSPLRKQSPPSGDQSKIEKGGVDSSESPVLKAKVGKYSKFENCQDV
eukprot:GFUD01018319.1.p1 GENE.GFUD01018319.1~~GFUD01018319.1.p1  ORF type:complete len:252 (-),score=79.60 GFUD01018319.1:90-800(-)